MKVEDLQDLVVGESQIISDIFFMKDSVHVLVSVSKKAMYPIISNGKKCRSLGVINDELKYVTPEEDGFDPDHEENEYLFIGEIGDTLYIKDCEAKEIISNFNIRKIDKSHSKYSSKLNTEAGAMIKLFKAIDINLKNR